MKNRGLYGCAEGNEKRLASTATLEHYADNNAVEGDQVAILRSMAEDQRWTELSNYCRQLKTQGHAQFRIDSMPNRATAGIKF